MQLDSIAEIVGGAVEFSGVAIIAGGLAVFTVAVAAALLRQGRNSDLGRLYRTYRQGVGRAILLGLEFLVAGDIIRTVAVSPTLRDVAVLAGIVAIRTFLSIALEVEIEGRWPWQHRAPSATVPK
jgi:uncharacterized membrane protein